MIPARQQEWRRHGGLRCLSALSRTQANADYAAVAGQTGVSVGDEDFQLTVRGRMQFKGEAFKNSGYDTQLSAQIVAQFGAQASKEVGNYAGSQRKELLQQAQQAAARGDTAEQGRLSAEAAKWDEGGSYRVALHTAVGSLSGDLSGAVGAAASAKAAPLLNDLQHKVQAELTGPKGENAQLAEGIAKLVTGMATAAVGSVAGGSGAAAAFNQEVNNRQLHPSERDRIKELAAKKTREFCQGDSTCQQKALLYWTDMLERAAEGRVDAREAEKNQTYYEQVLAASGRKGTEASMGAGERFFDDLREAKKLIATAAGSPILDPSGKAVLGSDGKPQTFFSASKEQQSDPYGNVFPGGSPNSQASVIAGKETRDQDRLERLNAINGSAIPDTTLEESLIGVRVPQRAAGDLAQVTERASRPVALNAEKAAERALLQSGGALDKTGQPLLDMSKLSTQQKGMMGELFGPDTVKQIVPDGEKIARVPGVGETGIDDLYRVNRPDVDYVVIEYKFVGSDGKVGSQVLGRTADGRQGSQTWIGGSDRVEKAVDSVLEVEKVRKSLESGRVESWVITTRSDGSTFLEVLDSKGKAKLIDDSLILLPGSKK